MRRLVERTRKAIRDARAHTATIAHGAEGWCCNTCCTGANGLSRPAAQQAAETHNARKHNSTLTLVRTDW